MKREEDVQEEEKGRMEMKEKDLGERSARLREEEKLPVELVADGLLQDDLHGTLGSGEEGLQGVLSLFIRWDIMDERKEREGARLLFLFPSLPFSSP